jgi:HD-GYP domain-containing protein (c-di-GMP phosphodiesterase class II)
MRVRFKVSLTVAILAVVCTLSLVIYSNIRAVGDKASHEAAAELFKSACAKIEQSTVGVINDSLDTAHLISGLDEIEFNEQDITASSSLRTIFKILTRNQDLYSIYFGYEDGRFMQVISAHHDDLIISVHNAPAETNWILRSIGFTETGERVQKWLFLDDNDKVLSSRSENNPAYDPRQRPWYREAIKSDGASLSDVYLFNSLQKPGITAARLRDDKKGVAGVDLTLRQLKKSVETTDISTNSQVIITDKNYRVIAKPDYVHGVKLFEDISQTDDAVWTEVSKRRAPGMYRFDVAQEEYYLKVGSSLNAGASFQVIVVAPIADFNEHFIVMQRQVGYTTLICLLLFIPATYYFSQHMANRVTQLAEDAQDIEDLNFEQKNRRPSRIKEFFELEQSFDEMRGSLRSKTQDLEVSQSKLNRLVELGISLSAERDAEKLMEMVLLGAKELTNADGGTLYKIQDNALSFRIIRNDTLGIAAGGTQGNEITLNPVPLYDDNGNENHKNVVSHSVLETQSILIEDAYNRDDFDFSGTKVFDEMNDYRSQSFLTIPLMPRGAKPIGALQLINCKDDQGNVIPFSEDILRFVEALGAQAATILYNLELLEAQENLMDSMIQLIAGAIDAKSPYTGGHCERVPELAMMMAEEACERQDGIFADFAFQNEDEWREFSIGAWLHDCGKVVTPEYVVDKATKLETIYNRIHEIRTRFEVLLRDAEVDYYKGLAEGGDKEALWKAYEDRKADLIEKYSFVAECNVGGEFMAGEKIERLKEIAQEEWVRNFDIRLGLSHEEEPLYADCEAGPVTENLLVDRAYHIIARSRDVEQQYADLDFKLPVPENLYNRGELYNLSVARGTLTEEERFKISEHIMQTIAMLEKMPFPPQLERVPEYAGTHHETMIGTGYPRQLDAAQLSVPSRIMAVADIFEALTASDRPYKKAKTLSEAIKILSFFKKDQHIDAEIFDLFLTSGIYKKYGERFLLPEQIDEVDITQYLS